jgi:hypothetical protein
MGQAAAEATAEGTATPFEATAEAAVFVIVAMDNPVGAIVIATVMVACSPRVGPTSARPEVATVALLRNDRDWPDATQCRVVLQ